MLIGSYIKENIDDQKKQLEQVIGEHTPYEYICRYDSSRDMIYCNEYCRTRLHDEYDSECPEKAIHDAERELSRLKMCHFLTLAFSDPNIAKANDLLPGHLLMSHL
jgi:hypothetical protein